MAQHSTSRTGRFIRRSLVGVLLATLVLLGSGALFWQQFKHDQGLEHLEWQGLRIRAGHLYLQHLGLERHAAGSVLTLTANDLRLDWRLGGTPYLQTLQIGSLTADWQPAGGQAEVNEPELQLSRPDPRELLPAWLPRQLQVEHFELTLPCPAGRCPLGGHFELDHGASPAAPARLQLSLQDAHPLELNAQVWGPPEHVDLAIQLKIDDHPRLSLTSIFREQADGGAWSGHLELPTLPEAPWLLGWLEQWSGPQPRLRGAADLQLTADWDWQLAPGPLRAAQLRTLTGHINLHGRLPTPWPLPGLGQLQGTAALQLQANAGQWRAHQLQADLTLEALDASLLTTLPAGLRPSAVRLQVQQHAPAQTPTTVLPIQLQLTSSGDLQLDAQADLQLNLAQDWWLQVDASHIRANAARLHLPPLAGRALRLDTRLNGRVDADTFKFNLDEASSLAVAELAIEHGDHPTRLQGLQVDRAALTISGILPGTAAQAFQVTGPARLRAEQIRHSALQPLGWSWEGQLNANPQRQHLDGALSNSAGLGGQLTLSRAPDALDIAITLPESFLRSGNPLAQTFSDWPALLELGNGRLQLNASLSLPAKGLLTARAEARLKGVSGLYDRTEFSGLDTQLNLELGDDQLRLAIAGLTLQQANPGFSIGPLQFNGEYRAPLAQLADGQLDWRTARTGLFGGEVWLEPASLRPGQQSVLAVQIRGLQLQELFRAYPAEGLSGQGTLDGVLPMELGPAGVRIVAGRLASREPGGQLQFNSPKIIALGRSNPAMQVVADALADFRYDLLSSGVDYDAQGTLRLALKLEGRNPDVERGRPINFSINLEEDIPALLTSLQLSGRVSDRVRERVQQHMEQSQPTP